jgi:hypothetical protein
VRGKLNVFQSAMLRWRDMHPYSAVHAVHVDGTLDRARLEAAIGQELTVRGLGRLTLDKVHRRYEYGGGEVKAVVRILPGASEPARVLAAEMARQLNEPFAGDGPIDPFRFFAIDAGAAFELGLAYDHFIAGGDSIVLLLKAIAARYAGDAAGASAVPTLYPETYRWSLARRPGALLRGLPCLPFLALSGRQSHRHRYPEGADGTMGLACCRLDAAELAAVLRTAREWNVTLNDLLLAVMLQVLSPLTLKRRTARRRTYLAAASIINIRRDLHADVHRAFGQFLSSFQVAHQVPDGITLAELARDVHAQTARIKRRHLYLQALIGIWYSGLIWPLLKAPQRGFFHTKNFPVCVGMSMLNVDGLWRQDGGRESPPRYVRAVPTGPVAPMVVAATTAGNALEIVISYRTAGYSREAIDGIVASSLACLRELSRDADGPTDRRKQVSGEATLPDTVE